MYAKGAPLMLDFAAMYTPSRREMWLHPGGLTFNMDETVRPATDDPKDDWWHKSGDEDYRKLKVAPFTSVEPQQDPDAANELATFGKVTAFHSTPQADFAEMKRMLHYCIAWRSRCSRCASPSRTGWIPSCCSPKAAR